jgi:hypothetical protein
LQSLPTYFNEPAMITLRLMLAAIVGMAMPALMLRCQAFLPFKVMCGKKANQTLNCCKK